MNSIIKKAYSKRMVRKFLIVSLITALGGYLLSWAFCPCGGIIQTKSWHLSSNYTRSWDTEIEWARANFGPILLQTDALEENPPDTRPLSAISVKANAKVRGLPLNSESKMQLRHIWEQRETRFRLVFICGLLWFSLCVTIMISSLPRHMVLKDK